MTGILDKLPPAVRHLVFTAAAVLALGLLDWAQTNYTTWNLNTSITGIIAVLIPVIIAYITPLTTQYGVGSVSAPADPSAAGS